MIAWIGGTGHRSGSHRIVPGRERVAQGAQPAAQVRDVASHDGGHRGVLDPPHPLGAVDLGPEVVGEERVRLQPPRGHEHEDPEGRLAEAEARQEGLGVQAHHQVHALHVAVEPGDPRGLRGVVAALAGERAEALRGRQPQHPAELVVARHPPLAVAQEVDGGDVHAPLRAEGVPGLAHQAAQRVREVVQAQRARVLDAERVPEVRQGAGVGDVASVAAGHLEKGQAAEVVVSAGGRAEGDLVGQQRVHPVDGDELLGDRVGHAVVVAPRPGDAGEEVPAHPLAQPAGAARAQDPPPVPAQRRLDRGVGEDGERPLDRVDLGHHGGVDHPGRLEEALVVPAGVVEGQVVADRVVLPREEVVQQRQAQPPVAVDARQVDPGVALEGQPAVGLQPQLAVAGEGPQQPLPLGRAAVELGPVPPVRLGVGEHRRAARSGPPRRRRRAHDLHGVAGRGPVVAGGSGTSTRSSRTPFPWLIQSWTMNCSQAAASRFRIVASWIVPLRARSASLTSRGLGSSRSPAGGPLQSGWFRPKGAPAAPVAGRPGSVNEPSAVRSRRGGGTVPGVGPRGASPPSGVAVAS